MVTMSDQSREDASAQTAVVIQDVEQEQLSDCLEANQVNNPMDVIVELVSEVDSNLDKKRPSSSKTKPRSRPTRGTDSGKPAERVKMDRYLVRLRNIVPGIDKQAREPEVLNMAANYITYLKSMVDSKHDAEFMAASFTY